MNVVYEPCILTRRLSLPYIMRAMIDARNAEGLTQKELSERSGIAQGDISKLENGNANPSIRTLQRLAAAMGKTLRIEFV